METPAEGHSSVAGFRVYPTRSKKDLFLTRGFSELKPKRFNVQKLLSALLEHWRQANDRGRFTENVALYLGDAEFADYKAIRLPKGITINRVFGLTDASVFDFLEPSFAGSTAVAFIGSARAEERTPYFRSLARTMDVLEPESYRLFRDQWYRPDLFGAFYRTCESHLVYQEKIGKVLPFELARRSERYTEYNHENELSGGGPPGVASPNRPLRDGFALGCLSVVDGSLALARQVTMTRFDHDLRHEDKSAAFFLHLPRFLQEAAPAIYASLAESFDLWLACPYPDMAATLALAFKNDGAIALRDIYYPAMRWGWHPMAELAGFLSDGKPNSLFLFFDGRQRLSVVAKRT